MTALRRFFVIRADKTQTMVNGDQLAILRQQGHLRPDDIVLPVPNHQSHLTPAPVAPLNAYAPQTSTADQFDEDKDIDTAPLSSDDDESESHGFAGADDFEIENALNDVESQSLYQLQADSQTPIQWPSASQGGQIPQSAQGYLVKLDDGRIVGPFPLTKLLQQINDNKWTGFEEIAAPKSSHFRPVRQVPAIAAALIMMQPSTYLDTRESFEIGPAGLVPILIELYMQRANGWLVLPYEKKTALLTISFGNVIHLRFNKQSKGFSLGKELGNLFSLEEGPAWFLPDPIAANDEKTIETSTVELCRDYLGYSSLFNEERLLRVFGSTDQVLQAASSEQFDAYKDILTPDEQILWHKIEIGRPTLASLIMKSPLVLLKYLNLCDFRPLVAENSESLSLEPQNEPMNFSEHLEEQKAIAPAKTGFFRKLAQWLFRS